MNVVAPPAKPVSRWRVVCAQICSAGAAFFTALWLLVLGFAFLQVLGHVYEGGELVFMGLFLTAPPVWTCTVAALLLVGPKRCKVAWISAFVYVAPIFIPFVIGMLVDFFSGKWH